jgi:hypothetical protein
LKEEKNGKKKTLLRAENIYKTIMKRSGRGGQLEWFFVEEFISKFDSGEFLISTTLVERMFVESSFSLKFFQKFSHYQ